MRALLILALLGVYFTADFYQRTWYPEEACVEVHLAANPKTTHVLCGKVVKP